MCKIPKASKTADDAKTGDADGGDDDECGPSPGCDVWSTYEDDGTTPPVLHGPSSAMVDFTYEIAVDEGLHSGRFDEIVGTKMERLLALLVDRRSLIGCSDVTG